MTLAEETSPSPASSRRDDLVESMLGASIAALELFAVYLGDRLGFYRSLVADGPATASQLAARTNTHQRYMREWLEQQAMAGVVDVLDTGNPETRVYSLPAGHDEALTNRDSLAFVAPLVRLIAGCVGPMPAILDAFRTGGGVPYPEYGADARDGIADMNRVMFINQLASEWLPALPDIHARLRDTDHPARVADIGCGTGWSTIAIAQGYPDVRIDGFDIDPASIETAQINAANLGLTDRISFQARDAGDPTLAGAYDFACAFECIHDMSDPIAALAAMHRLVGEGGTVLIADERVADVFDASTRDEIERLMYGFSIFHCLPVGMADQPSVGTGTVMRTDIFRGYAKEAGFQAVEVLPIDNIFWRFYRLTA